MIDDSRRLLPSVASLHSLVAAADLQSFSRAAERLGLTQSAVSRQIAHLEDRLQLQLFDRVGRNVKLTNEGRDYVEAIRPALTQIRNATALAIDRRPDRELLIATLPSFGMRWLAPRLPVLSYTAPDLIVNFSARSVPFEFSAENFDAAIHFGTANWSEADHDFLFAEDMIVVTAPSFLEQHRVSQPGDLLHLPLLALQSRKALWSKFFSAAGIDAAIPRPAATFEHFLMLAQAAVAGAGAAMLPRFLIEIELQSRLLVQLFDDDLLMTTGAYFLVYPQHRLEKLAFREFRDWLLHEATQPRIANEMPVSRRNAT